MLYSAGLWHKPTLERELHLPQSRLGRRYFLILICTIILSVLYLFIQEEYPKSFPLGSIQLLIVELLIFIIFSLDLGLRLYAAHKTLREIIYLVIDLLAIIPSAVVLLHFLGLIEAQHIEFLALLRLFRMARILKLLRLKNAIIDVFGASVLTLVFATMALHLGIRVALSAIENAFGLDIYTYLDRSVLMIAVTAVGSVFGIALAITFGIVKRKQLEISELHRAAIDSLNWIEADIRRLKPDSNWPGTAGWRADLAQFLEEEIPYPLMKERTNTLLHGIRQEIMDRPSLDVPFHNKLAARMTEFLTKTQVEFHPVFYKWLNRIAQLYFLLVLLAAPGLNGVFVQLLVIYVFQGLVVIIDDMDHAVDKSVTVFNSKILEI